MLEDATMEVKMHEYIVPAIIGILSGWVAYDIIGGIVLFIKYRKERVE